MTISIFQDTRKRKTVLWLMGTTLITFLPLCFEDELMQITRQWGSIYENIAKSIYVLPSLLFGIAVSISNASYLRFRVGSAVLIPVLFFGIYLFGTMPFYALGYLYESEFTLRAGGCFGCLFLTGLVLRLLLKETVLGYEQLLQMVLLAPITIAVLMTLENHHFFVFRDSVSRYALMILVHQSAITVQAVLIMD